MPEPYSSETALEIIRSILLHKGRLIIRKHCYVRMGVRTVDDLDIKKVLLENGKISREPEWDINHRKWKYRVEGLDTEGEQLSVILNISEQDGTIIAITVFGN